LCSFAANPPAFGLRPSFGFRLSAFGFLLLAFACSAQPKSELAPTPPLEPAEGIRQAKALVARLLAQKPDQNATNNAQLKIRDPKGQQREVPIRFSVFLTATNWLSVYQAAPDGNPPGEVFTVIHIDGQPNQYLLRPSDSDSPVCQLTRPQLMQPFAGSDFWLADLSLDFLQWPEQRVLRKHMRKNLFCDELQSTNPDQATGAYSNVVAWIAVNRPDEIVVTHADASDAAGKLLKEFDPKKVQKINGTWQLEEMEIRNRQTRSRTRIEFNLDEGR
jgi:hypothetical protein